MRAACTESTDPAGPIPGRDGLVYSAELVEAGPEAVIGRARIANLGSGSRVLRFPDSPPPIEITLEPGEVREFERYAYASVIQLDRWPPSDADR